MEEPMVMRIAKKYDKLPAQVLLRYVLQLGVVVLAKSVIPERIESNMDVGI